MIKQEKGPTEIEIFLFGIDNIIQEYVVKISEGTSSENSKIKRRKWYVNHL